MSDEPDATYQSINRLPLDEMYAYFLNDLKSGILPIKSALELLKDPNIDDVTREQLRDIAEASLKKTMTVINNTTDIYRAYKVNTINRVIEYLEYVLLRPGMYFGTRLDVDSLTIFLTGFYSSFSVAGLGLFETPRDETYKAVVEERGWEMSAVRGIWHSMQAKGLSEEDVFREVLTVEIEAWKKRLEALER